MAGSMPGLRSQQVAIKAPYGAVRQRLPVQKYLVCVKTKMLFLQCLPDAILAVNCGLSRKLDQGPAC